MIAKDAEIGQSQLAGAHQRDGGRGRGGLETDGEEHHLLVGPLDGDLQCVHRSFDVVGTNYVSTLKRHGSLGAESPEQSFSSGPLISASCERATNEGFARNTRQQREIQLVEFAKAPEQRIIFFKTLAEAETRIYNDAVAFDLGGNRGFCTLAKLTLDQ